MKLYNNAYDYAICTVKINLKGIMRMSIMFSWILLFLHTLSTKENTYPQFYTVIKNKMTIFK